MSNQNSADPAVISSAPGSVFDGYVVGIGASAGGLDALEKFFKACPTDLGVAYVVVQHLSPDHKSMMRNLLARHTDMPVITVEDDMVIERDHIYLIPPGAIMHVTPGHLHLKPKSPRILTLPIDIFFASLADVYQTKSVGVILSGTGTDGTRGVLGINARGGFLMVQEPESSKFDGMPRSAVATGVVDSVLPVDELPARLVAHVRDLPVADLAGGKLLIPYSEMPNSEVLTAILRLLLTVGGIDFADYKLATLMRRIERRMQVRRTHALHQYLDILEGDHAEVLTLRREILISVTSFFRDPETFELLSSKVIEPMVADLPAGSTVRVWTGGVATGEEAYTIAMLFIEAFEKYRRWPSLKIFATDVDQSCVEAAGSGAYPESAAAELSPERLERFFVRKGNHFVVKNELRQCIVFARHNLLADPPFTRIDLVVCRNTLIYFKSGAQERALRSLQYSLRDGGTLMLGPSEAIASETEGLTVINSRHKLYRRTGAARLPIIGSKAADSTARPAVLASPNTARSRRKSVDLLAADAGVATLMNHYAPPSMVVNEAHEVVHLYGDVNKYLVAREGAASLDINRILPDELVPVATALLFKAARDQESVLSGPVYLAQGEGRSEPVRLAVHPLKSDTSERMTLLCIEVPGASGDGSLTSVDVDAETMERAGILERELAATRESLQATIEELETSNEELQATNEELMASNEELQSANEELQSVNEEMTTVNAEFQEKMHILNRTHADLDSMAKAVGVATIFVDDRLMITRFSPDAARIFKVRDSDVGRRLDDIAQILNYPGLVEDLETTLATERMIEREVPSMDGNRIYVARILPYTVPSTTLRGAVATFVDVTAYHDARRLQTVIDALPEHIAVLDRSGTIVLVNAAWTRFAQANGDPDLTKSGVGVNYLANAGDGSDPAQQGIRKVLEGSLASFSIEYPCHSPGEDRWFVMNVAPVSGTEFGAVISHINVTAWFQKSSS